MNVKYFFKISALILSCLLIFSSCISPDNSNQKNGNSADNTEELPPLTRSQRMIMNHIGAELTENGNIDVDGVIIDRRKKIVTFPAKINMWSGELEVVACNPRGRRHESLLITDINPFRLQLALILSGAKNGAEYAHDGIPRGTLFDVFIQFPEIGEKLYPIHHFIKNIDAEKMFSDYGWVFVGSNFSKNNVCLANIDGNLINVNSRDKNTIVSSLILKEKLENILEVNTDILKNITADIPELGKNFHEASLQRKMIPVKVILKRRVAPDDL